MRECGDRIRRERVVPLSPRLALRRVLVLSEGRQFREAAAVLARLGPNALVTVASELPLDSLVEGLPHSAQLLETFFGKLIAANQPVSLNSEPVLWQLIRLLSYHEEFGLKSKIGKLAQTVIEFQPDLHGLIITRKKAVDQAIEGLGCHGLTTDATGFTHLHVALKAELQVHIESYKSALQRLEEVGVRSSNFKKPIDASHHRLLSLNLKEVQQRLIDNKTLLTILDKPALKQLRNLIDTLAKRVQNDKEALFCISQIKRLQGVDEDKPVASVLMSFSRGCASFLELVQIRESLYSSDGYHSGSEQQNGNGEDAVSKYSSLYYQDRPNALDALDSLSELRHATQLKDKILFSIVVLSFRTCKSLREMKIHETLCNLHINSELLVAHKLRESIIRCFSATFDNFPLHDVERQVHGLICETLKEYRCLETCTALNRFIANVTRVCWYLVNQESSFELDVDFRIPVQFHPEKHQRHHTSNRKSNTVRCYLWPALIRGSKCVYKAVVITT